MTDRLGSLDRLISLAAPRNWFDFLVKTLFFMQLIGAMNYVRDHIQDPADVDSLLSNTLEATFVGLPFCILAMVLIWRLKVLQDEFIALASTDMLTGLNNRRAFYDKASTALPTSGGVLLMIDVDHFKQVNDRFGHAVGDLCLQAVAAHIQRFARSEDIVARFGGEEFAVLLAGADAAAAQDIGDRLTGGVQLALQEEAAHDVVTLSVGAVPLDSSSSLDAGLRAADEALYVAKRNGRARMEMALNFADQAA